jgi:predicted small secreted protein
MPSGTLRLSKRLGYVCSHWITAADEKDYEMKKTIIIPALALAAVFLTACNTVEGVGEDVQAGGEAIEDTAKTVKDDITE